MYELYKKAAGINDPLQEKSQSFTAAASLPTTSTFTAPTKRGDILGVQVFLSDNTLADLVGSVITIASNGVNVFENVSLAKFASLYQNANNEFPFFAPEGSVITIVVQNASAVAFKVDVNFLFRPPHIVNI